ncbi:geranylgeranylglycerol-phosphate geranylgeranyltransferase [Halobaculum sp. CBA1158]|uniref:geranylgeranylglycerol-phosphate geranylgeranyltransferase n=1 Tax=Halobaculum sp. CBA1158 TaxID=2904243 RepID=UPI001F402B72|nr:geranylgeranylglycerol-phosphate geranylgeranyltransferase [Halobaculum sp. CBA1158]UIO99166.1 geranylgeranylglycerol-phosphate geranylgeranyltransferase [Halobaculum sp. CBA1158]
MDPTRTLEGYLELARPGNAVAAGALTFVGSFVAGGLDAPVAVVFAVVATAAATAAGNAVNDYFDREIDAVNRPGRPIPSGRVPARGAAAYAGVLFAVATAAAVTLPPLALGIAVANLLALLAYTQVFKGLPAVGNVVVAYLTGSTFLFGAAAVGGLSGPTWTLFGLAATATFAREVVKDVEDVAGDREEGLRTLPIVAGERPALALATAAMAVAALASALPYLRGTFGAAYLAVVVPADAAMLGATAWGFRDPATAQRWIKRGTFLAAIAFVAGRATVVVA